MATYSPKGSSGGLGGLATIFGFSIIGIVRYFKPALKTNGNSNNES
jgi:hypothetical protein